MFLTLDHLGNKLQQVLEYHFSQCGYVITLMRKRRPVPRQGHCLCLYVLLTSSRVFSRCSSFLPHPKDVRIRWTGVSSLSQSEWVRCGCECPLWWQRVLAKVAYHLAPWAASRGSGYTWSWTKISRLEKNYFTCFTNLFKMYIELTFILMFNIRSILGSLEVQWYFCD